MAAIAVPLVLTALEVEGAALVAATVAAVLVDRLLIFPPPDQVGPKFGEQAVQSGTEGAPVLLYVGPDNRNAGSVIFASELIVVSESEKAKGGGSITTVSHSRDIQWGVAENDGITGLKRMFLDGALFYDKVPDVVVIADDITAHIHVLSDGPEVEGPQRDRYSMHLTSPTVDWTQFIVHVSVTMTGWSTAPNNGVLLVTEVASNRLTLYWGVQIDGQPPGIPEDEAAGPTITLTQEVPEFDPAKATSIQISTGELAQVPNVIVESHLGAGEVSAFRGLVTVVAEGLSVQNTAGRTPNATFVPEVSQDPTPLAVAITSLLRRAGFTDSEFDITGISGNFKGTVVRGPVPVGHHLGAIAIANDLLTQEYNGVLEVYHFGDKPVRTLPAGDLAAHTPGQVIERPIKGSEVDQESIPRQINVGFVDINKDYQHGSEGDRHRSVLSRVSNNVQTIELPISMTGNEAATIGRRIRLMNEVGRLRCEMQLAPKYVDVLENDLLSFVAFSDSWVVRVLRKQRGSNGLILIEAIRDELEVHNTAPGGDDSEAGGQGGIAFPPALFPVIVDIAAFREEDTIVAGYYHGSALFAQQALFQGGAFFESIDNGVQFTRIRDLLAEATLGFVQTVLAAGPTNVWDDVSTVDVKFLHGTPVPSSKSAVIAGANVFVVGLEVIGVVDVTPLGNFTYRFSTLARGLRNTEAVVGSHTTTTIVSKAQSAGTYFESIPTAALGSIRRYKAVSPGGSLSESIETSNWVRCATIRPFGPFRINGVRNAIDDDIVITWLPRTRSLVDIFTDSTVPLLEDFEWYEIDFVGGRTAIIQNSRTYTYTEAAQTADGLTPGDPVDMTIYQISTRGIGRGNATEATI